MLATVNPQITHLGLKRTKPMTVIQGNTFIIIDLPAQ